jgi:hypothetical protein
MKRTPIRVHRFFFWQRIWMALGFFIVTYLLCSDNAPATTKLPPFYPGERLVFIIKWGVIPAGEVYFEVLPFTKFNGVDSYHFRMTAKSYPHVDLFYKLRDRIDSYTNVGMTHSIHYEKKRSGKKKKNIVVRFDWNKDLVQYSNQRRTREAIDLLPGTFDPLAIFYAFRLQELGENRIIRIPVTDGKKCVIGKASVVRRERVESAGTVYDTYLVEPDTSDIGGIFEKAKDAKIQVWVTADHRRIPVKVRSKIILGHFVGELVETDSTVLLKKAAVGFRNRHRPQGIPYEQQRHLDLPAQSRFN